MNRPIYKNYLGGRQVVGVIASEDDLQFAIKNPTVAHGFEIRADYIDGPRVEEAMKQFRKAGRFTILTVRAKEEGSRVSLSIDERCRRFMRYLHLATFCDFEAAFADQLKDVIFATQKEGVGRIISAHFPNEMPHRRVVYERLSICEKYEGSIFKLVAVAQNLREYCEFTATTEDVFRGGLVKFAPMCMDELFGEASRLVALASGAALVYGWLVRPVVPGQLSASELMVRAARFA